MNATQQETLYRETREKHPGWTPERCSGYVHGSNDTELRKEPLPSYLDEGDNYAAGYMQGWRDHHED
jgi:hypothetical protein